MPLLSGCGTSAAINGKLYVTTACNGYSGVQTFLHVYDPVTDSWGGLAPSPHAHEAPAGGVIADKFYVVGGYDGSNYSNVLDVYDPTTNTWTTKAPMRLASFISGAGAVIDGKLYVVGGQDAAGNFLSTVEVYDPLTDTWTTDTPMPTARAGLVTAVVNGGALYGVGGANSTSVVTTNEAFTPSAAINQAPAANAGGPYRIFEGNSLTLDASGSSDPDGDPLTYSWDVNGDRVFGDATGVKPTLTWLQLQALGIDDGLATFDVKVRVDDGHGHTVHSPATTLTVFDTLPTVTLNGPVNGVPGQPRSFTFSADDPSVADKAGGFLYQIVRGDGSLAQIVAPSPGNGGGVRLDHVYTAPGSYVVQMTATDKDGTSAAVTGLVTVQPVQLQAGTLAVGGTPADDTIILQSVDALGNIRVTMNGVIQGTLPPTVGIAVFGEAGNDVIRLWSASTVPAVLSGGDGNDVLDALNSMSPNILLGGPGNDVLVSGRGRTVLIGGLGSDALLGAREDDLLIAGTTAFDANLAALSAIQAEWASTRDYATRIGNLSGTGSGQPLNGDVFLKADGPGRTVFDDGAIDALFGGAGQDWFFARSGQDFIIDFNPAEIVDIIG